MERGLSGTRGRRGLPALPSVTGAMTPVFDFRVSRITASCGVIVADKVVVSGALSC